MPQDQSIFLYPMAASGNALRVWAGALNCQSAPALQWSLDGKAVQPSVLRPMTSVRPPRLLNSSNTERAFSGIFEFPSAPDTFFDVTVRSNVETVTQRMRTLPSRVPSGMGASFNVLLVSCFHQAEDRSGLVGTIVDGLRASAKPHLTILAGDQVYLDLPTLANFPNDPVWLADKFERDYVVNWTMGSARVMAAAPTVCVPDDHEYWNNYPHPATVIQNSWTKDGRKNWREAARALYAGFQLPAALTPGDALTLDVDPLTFFFADTRSERDEDRKFVLNAAALKAFKKWASDAIQGRKFPVVVTGQPLFASTTGRIEGKVGDFSLADYGDFGSISQVVEDLAAAGRPLLCLTGDVHWGRVSSAVSISSGRVSIIEAISSPSSLVSTVGADQLSRGVNVLKGLFGRDNPWPRHSEGQNPPDRFAKKVAFPINTIHKQRGNHVALLAFRRTGGSLECVITYWPISLEARVGRPVTLPALQLQGG